MSSRVTPVQNLRWHHRGLVLEALRTGGPQPRAQLARNLGLSATTMTKVVGQLLDEGLVCEGQLSVATDAAPGGTSRVGRPSTDIAISPGARQVIGVQIRAGRVHLARCDLLATVLERGGFEFRQESGPEQVLDEIVRRVTVMLSAAGVGKARVLGVGIGVPGPVDPENRTNLLSVNLGWRNVPFSDYLESRLGVPAVVDHNVRAMALAEARIRNTDPDNDPLLYVYPSSGVGAGLVVSGAPFHPGCYGVTELGHLRVVDGGLPCACGASGCLETVASETALINQIRHLLGQESANPLADLYAGGFAEILGGFVEHLTTALASAVNLLNPRLVVLGGMFDSAPDPVFELVQASLRSKAFPLLRDLVRVERSQLGADSGVIGAATKALDHFLYQAKITNSTF